MRTKTLFRLGGLLVAFVIGSCGGCYVWKFYEATEAETDAEEFFLFCGQDKLDAAYDRLLPAWQRQIDRQTFQNFIHSMALDQFAGCTWTSRSAKNNSLFFWRNGFGMTYVVVTLEGVLTFRSGASARVKLELMREKRVWKLASILYELPVAPGKEECDRLARNTVRAIEEAIRNKDFKRLHGRMANAVKQQITPASIENGMRDLIDKKVDLFQYRDKLPAMDKPPEIDANRLLVLSGRVIVKKEQLQFEFKFVFEDLQWKLCLFTISSQLPAEPDFVRI